ncbi:hypothetical protein ACK3YQ_06210 [Aeromonas caviae]|uniref:hypothetical protein n=1 Tax=Aeromonas sp. TaxID=647 RepID=UPI00290BD8B7|nr:hypothetical protein [Aeromonas sp.]MDU7578872.1 hypothetical protein [Aeromonas sp.]
MSDTKKESHPLEWLTTSDALMIILIGVTAFFGYKSYETQKEGVELQRSIYQPRFVPTEIQQPKIISEKTLARVAISNLGYTPGTYRIKVTSDTFSFDSDNYGSGRELEISYMLKHDDSDNHEFYIIPPTSGKKPVFASYQYAFDGENGFRTTRKFCYQLNNNTEYAEVVCP